MQTNIIQTFLNTAKGQEADQILRSCVHCGFCTATCPTYQLLGSELDSPRGRIYLIKQMLEGNEVSEKTQLHLDRCLTCRSCETTCPSGVQYSRLIDIGRDMVERQVSRPLITKFTRFSIRNIVPYPKRFATMVKLGYTVKHLIPAALQQKLPQLPQKPPRPQQSHTRQMLVLEGCAQSVATPETNASAARILDRLGVGLISPDNAGCCGAVSHHLAEEEEGREFMRRNIDAWWPYIEQGIEAIIVTASGCGVMVKDYGHLLKDDKAYADKAKRVSELAKDISEIIANEDLSQLTVKPSGKIAFHSPCTLQHGQKLNGLVEKILTGLGFELTQVADAHLCCGSAGTYSILQPQLSQQLLDNKLSNLNQGQPDIIATANVGCQMHMTTKSQVPVKHWIELIDESITGGFEDKSQ